MFVDRRLILVTFTVFSFYLFIISSLIRLSLVLSFNFVLNQLLPIVIIMLTTTTVYRRVGYFPAEPAERTKEEDKKREKMTAIFGPAN